MQPIRPISQIRPTGQTAGPRDAEVFYRCLDRFNWLDGAAVQSLCRLARKLSWGQTEMLAVLELALIAHRRAQAPAGSREHIAKPTGWLWHCILRGSWGPGAAEYVQAKREWSETAEALAAMGMRDER